MCFGRVQRGGCSSILTMGRPMMSRIWLATWLGSFTIFMVAVRSLCVWMMISPLFTIRPINDCATSRSLKPDGERMKFLVLAIPVLTSRLPLRNVYLFELLMRSKGRRLTSQTMRNKSSVGVKIGTPKIDGVSALNTNSSQTTTMASTRNSIVLDVTLGSIQGRPVQSERHTFRL